MSAIPMAQNPGGKTAYRRSRIERAANALDRTSPELRRPVYASLLKFAELYPTKLRLGVFAPSGAHFSVSSTNGSNGAPNLRSFELPASTTRLFIHSIFFSVSPHGSFLRNFRILIRLILFSF